MEPWVSIRSPAIARELLYSGRSYVDFFPYERTEQVAKRFFRGGRPYTNFDQATKAELAFLHAMRNDIAHRSRASQAKFENMCIGRGITLPTRDMVTHRYLQTLFSVGRTRFEHHVSQLLSIAQQLER